MLTPNESSPHGQSVGNVWASSTSDDALEVEIEAKDLGHAGKHGLAY
jgi:hypothetical protein